MYAARPPPLTDVPAEVASHVVTQYAPWFVSTRRTSQPAERSGAARPLPRQSKRGRQRKPAARSEGSRARAWTAIPAVVPQPRRAVSPGVSSPPSPTTRKRPKTATATTLLRTGVHIMAPNRPRALRTCPSRVKSPRKKICGRHARAKAMVMSRCPPT
ncbi:hypothetical protein STANM309S_05301 [Streptomyces tanashiensis]